MQLPELDMRAYGQGPGGRRSLAQALQGAFSSVGFASLCHHGIGPELTEPAFEAVRAFFALPDPIKHTYHQAGGAGARGYTPFGIERAKDARVPDLKEFWHVGRELPAHAEPRPELLPNLWPAEVPEFRPALLNLYRALEQLGNHVLAALALSLELPEDYFTAYASLGNSILRALHYPPLPEAHTEAVRSAAHEDINLITLLVAADEPGLQIRTLDGRWLALETEPGAILCNVGDMLQRHTNHRFVSTTHRVVNPKGTAAGRSRYSLPFFLHPEGDMPLASLPSCVSDTHPDRNPEPISADAYLQQRLREIGLR